MQFKNIILVLAFYFLLFAVFHYEELDINLRIYLVFLIRMLTLRDIMPTVVIIYDNYDGGKCGPKQYDFRQICEN